MFVVVVSDVPEASRLECFRLVSQVLPELRLSTY